MPYREFHYRWEYDLKSSPEQIWPFVADTNRFNHDTGVPSVEIEDGKSGKLANARRRLRLTTFGLPVEWEEQPFEWIRPSRFGVTRRYTRGPMAELRVLLELLPHPEGGTKLTYQIWVTPKSFLGVLAIPLQIGSVSALRFGKAFKRYDELAISTEPPIVEPVGIELSPADRQRLDAVRERLLSTGAAPPIVNRLIELIENADDLTVARLRPYELADRWRTSRRAVLETCLWATRVGLLDLQWDLLCPLCRGAQENCGSLREINRQIHCESCRIDFTINFDRFVEVTFRPNAAVRRADVKEYCLGSPQRTPHVIAQQLVTPKSERTIAVSLEAGNYRVRVFELPGEQLVKVTADGASSAVVSPQTDGRWPDEELYLSPTPTLRLENATDIERLYIFERVAWSDQAATAAEVTALQVFRDLFASEALRPGEQISVGSLTVLFTDLRHSTRLYREVGDAKAFGRVMNHFDVLKEAIADEDGALVKTIGDAVMAVFRRPVAALKAMLKAQKVLASPADGSPPLTLKAGMHSGPCIAVTLNDRLDYFGSTVNLAARLEGFSTGNDVVLSRAVFSDPEIQELVNNPGFGLAVIPFEVPLKGFDEERFELLRVAATKGMAEGAGSG